MEKPWHREGKWTHETASWFIKWGYGLPQRAVEKYDEVRQTKESEVPDQSQAFNQWNLEFSLTKLTFKNGKKSMWFWQNIHISSKQVKTTMKTDLSV